MLTIRLVRKPSLIGFILVIPAIWFIRDTAIIVNICLNFAAIQRELRNFKLSSVSNRESFMLMLRSQEVAGNFLVAKAISIDMKLLASVRKEGGMSIN